MALFMAGGELHGGLHTLPFANMPAHFISLSPQLPTAQSSAVSQKYLPWGSHLAFLNLSFLITVLGFL